MGHSRPRAFCVTKTSALGLQRELMAPKLPSPFTYPGPGKCPAKQRLNQKLNRLYRVTITKFNVYEP